MSVLPFPQRTNSSADLQVWNNAAYDNEYSEDFSVSTQSWGSLKSIFGNPNESLDSVLGKENQVRTTDISVSLSNTPFKPVNRDVGLEKLRNKGAFKNEENIILKQKGFQYEKKIDEEIEQIESEINRLSSRLEVLMLEKAKRSVKLEKRGRIVSAKFMEQNVSLKSTEERKKIEENISLSGKLKVNRRGLSLGPAEIVNARQRGMSMGPSEIVSASKLKQFGKQEIITPVQSRRKSCFMKLKNIDEEKVVKSLSVSPKSRKIASKNQAPSRKAVTTVSKKVMKKDDLVINSVQPKKLFKDGENSVPPTNKKLLRPGRVVASRYNQSTSQASVMRKRFLPENDKEDGKAKKPSLSSGKSDEGDNECLNFVTASRVKKMWEIPSEIVVHCSVEDEKPVESVVVVPDLLPRIKIGRNLKESPQDSGPAKRVAELVGRKSFFAEEGEGYVVKNLRYDEEEGEGCEIEN